MKLSQESNSQYNQLHTYGDDFIVIKKDNNELQRIDTNLVVTPQQVIEAISVDDITQLSDSDINLLTALDPEIIIFVTGSGLSEFTFQISARFNQHHIGTEFMSLGAACRTYNLLVNEDRNVVLVICCF